MNLHTRNGLSAVRRAGSAAHCHDMQPAADTDDLTTTEAIANARADAPARRSRAEPRSAAPRSKKTAEASLKSKPSVATANDGSGGSGRSSAEYQRKWRAANPEKCRKYRRSDNARHREKRVEYRRKWRAANRERSRTHIAAFRARNLEKCRAKGRHYAKLYSKSHPGAVAEKSRQQRAKLSDSYVARNILGVPTKECPPDLLELTRAHIQLQRELRNNPR